MNTKIAVEYAKRGWAVFPCKGKIPLTPRGFRDASKDPNKVEKLFKSHAEANIGIATGKISGFFVIDIDVHGDIDGNDSIEDLQSKFGKLPNTVESITWSGGRHILFKSSEISIGNRTKVLPGVDVRGTGGYIIAPPSIIDDKEYIWEASSHPDNIPIAEAPEWLINLLCSDDIPEIPGTTNEINKISAGARNDKLMRKGIGLRKEGLPYETIIIVLKDLNRLRCSPMLKDREVETIARSVARYKPEEKKPIDVTKEPYTDVWNANLMHAKYGDMVKYCNSLGGWYIWDGTKWQRDEKFEIVALAKNTVKHMFDMAANSDDKPLYNHAKQCESEGRLRNMVNLVKSQEGMSVKSDTFDDNIYFLNCINGTLDLESGGMSPHLKNNYITKIVQIPYKNTSTCPAWNKFLDDIFMGNTETIHFVHKAVGYSLSGSIEEQCMFILYGTGSNGKSTFLETLSKIMGDYAMSTLASTIMEKHGSSGIPNDVARLKGSRFVNAIETEENKKLAESTIKTITGGDKIVARFLNKEFFEFYATFKLFLATNHKPRISGTDNGIWRRIRYIPFKKVISPEERDKTLPVKLSEEFDGILSWAVKGFKLWQTEGLGTCEEVEAATREYREESDILKDYMADRCVLGRDYSVVATQLYKDVNTWFKENLGYRISRNKVIEYLEAMGITKIKLTGGDSKGSMGWQGLRMKTDTDFFGEENSDKRPY